VIPAKALQEDTILYVEGSRVALTGDFFGEIITDFSYEEGVLAFSSDEMSVKLEMQKDLLLRMTVSAGGEDLTMVLSPYMTELLTSSIEGEEAEREDE